MLCLKLIGSVPSAILQSASINWIRDSVRMAAGRGFAVTVALLCNPRSRNHITTTESSMVGDCAWAFVFLLLGRRKRVCVCGTCVFTLWEFMCLGVRVHTEGKGLILDAFLSPSSPSIMSQGVIFEPRI